MGVGGGGGEINLDFFFYCASVVIYVMFVFSLFLSRFSFLCCLRRAVHYENMPIQI